jgi:hypothetical protein
MVPPWYYLVRQAKQAGMTDRTYSRMASSATSAEVKTLSTSHRMTDRRKSSHEAPVILPTLQTNPSVLTEVIGKDESLMLP